MEEEKKKEKKPFVPRQPRRQSDHPKLPAYSQVSSDFVCEFLPEGSRCAIILYLYLKDRNQKKRKDGYAENESWASYETIMEETNLSNKTQIRKGIVELASAGFLTVQLGEEKPDGSRSSSHYFTNDIPKVDEDNLKMIKNRSFKRIKKAPRVSN